MIKSNDKEPMRRERLDEPHFQLNSLIPLRERDEFLAEALSGPSHLRNLFRTCGNFRLAFAAPRH
jgi:hypothetical protein